MNHRPPPRIAVAEIVARAVFNPSGAHQLEIAVPSGLVSMTFEAQHVPQLERAIARFREHITFEEGRETARVKSIPLETRT